jgi:site-specific DNA-methyltransferase (adenine-specific)
MKLTDKITVTNECNMKLMARYPDNHFDLAVVDPPYGIDGNSHRQNKSRGKLTKSTDYHNALWDQVVPDDKYFDELFRVSKHQIIWGINYFKNSRLKSAGRIVWDKVNGDTSYSDAEIAYASMFYSVRVVNYMWNGMMQGRTIGRSSSIMEGKKELNEFRIHPTQKPVKLYKWLLTNYAENEFKILDTHLGSGSIVIACHDLGFELTACELDPKYYKDSIKRFNEVTAQTDLFKNTLNNSNYDPHRLI